MSYFILFMCFYTHIGYQVCSTAQFPDLKQCQHSASKIKKQAEPSALWCQQVKNNHHIKGD